jgi:hypothetical protein
VLTLSRYEPWYYSTSSGVAAAVAYRRTPLNADPLGGLRSNVTFQELGGIGELIGGIGVIVSLLYLSRQVRDNSRLERLNVRFSVSQSLMSALERLDEDPELRRIWDAASDRDEELDEAARERLGRFLYRYFAQLALASGFTEIDPEIRTWYEPMLRRFLRVPAVQGWWSRQREFISEPFRSEVDSLLREILDS